VQPVECVVRSGELIYVPRGWWHLALNLEESLAITHNYVSAANLPHVLSFLGSRSQALVSGCALDDRCARLGWAAPGLGLLCRSAGGRLGAVPPPLAGHRRPRPPTLPLLPAPCARRSSLHDRFVEALRSQRPEVLEALEEQRRAKRQKLEQQSKLSALFRVPAAPAAGGQEEAGAERAGATDGGGAGSASSAPEGGGGFTFGFAFGSK
jgi:hypothetical protein